MHARHRRALSILSSRRGVICLYDRLGLGGLRLLFTICGCHFYRTRGRRSLRSRLLFRLLLFLGRRDLFKVQHLTRRKYLIDKKVGESEEPIRISLIEARSNRTHLCFTTQEKPVSSAAKTVIPNLFSRASCALTAIPTAALSASSPSTLGCDSSAVPLDSGPVKRILFRGDSSDTSISAIV